MFSAMLLTISIVALAQFVVYYVRSVVAGVAAQPISEEVMAAVSRNVQRKSSSIGLVRAYFPVVHAIGRMTSGRIAALANWAESERMLCVRYAAVQVDRRLQSNLALAASIRSC